MREQSHIYRRIVDLRDRLRADDANNASFVANDGYANVSVSQDRTGASRFYGDGTGRRVAKSPYI